MSRFLKRILKLFLVFCHFNHRIASELLTVRGNPSVRHWNVEDGYLSNVGENVTYPHRVFDSGLFNAMVLDLFMIEGNAFHICNEVPIGFAVFLHMGDSEVSEKLSSELSIPPDHYTTISIVPKVTRTSNGLRSYAPQVRGCYFRFERKLHLFRTYSQQKCQQECYSNYTKDACGCVPFFLPSKHTKSSSFIHL